MCCYHLTVSELISMLFFYLGDQPTEFVGPGSIPFNPSLSSTRRFIFITILEAYTHHLSNIHLFQRIPNTTNSCPFTGWTEGKDHATQTLSQDRRCLSSRL